MKLLNKKISDVGSIRNGFAFKSSDYTNSGVLLVRQSNISKDIVSVDKSKYLPKTFLDHYKDYQVKYGDYIIGMSGSIGKVSVYKFEVSALQNQRTGVIQSSSESTKKYIAHFLRYMANAQLNLSKGVAVQNISSKQIESFEIPIPDNEEDQQKIVDKIEELFSVIDHNSDSLKATKRTLINLRRKTLDHAFKGKLSTDVNDSNFDFDSALQKLEESRKKLFSSFKKGRYKQARSDIHKVNSKWLEIPLESFGLIETGATPLKGNPQFWKNGTIPWITSTVVNQQKVTTASELITDKALKETNTKLFPIGTLLIAMYGEGKTRGKVSELMIEAATNQALAGVILSEEAKPYKDFIKLYLYKNYEDLRRLASGGVQPNLNLNMIKEMPIPFPSRKEQLAIIDILTQYLSIIDYSIKNLDQVLTLANTTKQSILKQAFEGKLI